MIINIIIKMTYSADFVTLPISFSDFQFGFAEMV